MKGYDDVIGGWVVALYKALLWKGSKPFELLKQSNIDLDELANVGSRVPLNLCNKLYEQAVILTDDPLLPIRVSQCVVASSFHALGYSILASATLKDAFVRIVQYERVLSSACSLSLSQHNDSYYLELSLKSGDADQHIADQLELTMLLSIIKISRDLSHPGVSPIRFYTTAKCTHRKQFEDYVGCEIEFSADNSMIIFDATCVEAKLPNFAPDLKILSSQATDEYLAGLDRNNIVSQVRSQVSALLATGAPSIDTVAENLNFSQRSLQRKLNDSGTSYKNLVESIRESMAEQYLNQQHLSLGEISYLLGFANVANFSRAFKRWKGVSPGAYRDILIS